MESRAVRIAANLERIQANIEKHAPGRPVRLVCVTKYASDEDVRHLLTAGASELGENLLPQGAARFATWQADGHRFTRHIIGAQQSRKLRLLPQCCDLFQAVDSLECALRLSKVLEASSGRLDVLLEVNIDTDAMKHGLPEAGLQEAVLSAASTCPGLRLRGLMAIPRAPGGHETSAQYAQRSAASFARLRGWFDRIAPLVPERALWNTLSMGMSQDYCQALREGSTMLRIGSALFAGVEG